MPLIRITSHRFVAALVAQHGMVVEAAPIVKYMLGWNGAQVARYCRSKGWTWERVEDPDDRGRQEAGEGIRPQEV